MPRDAHLLTRSQRTRKRHPRPALDRPSVCALAPVDGDGDGVLVNSGQHDPYLSFDLDREPTDELDGPQARACGHVVEHEQAVVEAADSEPPAGYRVGLDEHE